MDISLIIPQTLSLAYKMFLIIGHIKVLVYFIHIKLKAISNYCFEGQVRRFIIIKTVLKYCVNSN